MPGQSCKAAQRRKAFVVGAYRRLRLLGVQKMANQFDLSFGSRRVADNARSLCQDDAIALEK